MLSVAVTYKPLLLQAQHWTAAARRLADMDCLASAAAWESLERYLHLELRKKLSESVSRLIAKGEHLTRVLFKTETANQHTGQFEVERLKAQYMKVETMLDFFAHALSTRTNKEMVSMMRACDRIAESAMKQLLEPLRHPTPPVLVYLDKGLGASILKAGLQLWDGYTSNPVAAIKVTRHNLLRPTALIHEAGHQVAHITKWNEELETGLRIKLKPINEELSDLWSGWASEITADVFAFVHTGFASVAALHDVVDGSPGSVFRYLPGDPHPICFLRVLLGVECCRECYGEGPWNDMQKAWLQKHKINTVQADLRRLIYASIKAMPVIAAFILKQPFRAFRGKSISDCIDPALSDPARMEISAREEGAAYYRSHYLVAGNPIQRLAWNGYQVATSPCEAEGLLKQQQQWMLQLGKSI
jgi:hypothetical protein